MRFPRRSASRCLQLLSFRRAYQWSLGGPNRNLRSAGGFFATVTHRMTEDRQVRGGWVSQRRLRAYVVAALAVAVVVAWTEVAGAATGGASPGPAPHQNPTPRRSTAQKARPNPLGGRAMWIWYVSKSNGGNLASFVATAHRYGISTVMIKSGDGSGMWSQFTAALVSVLHANGLRVCGWQYVYGNHPVAEAQVGAATVSAGADCLLIDAEGEYEGKYVQAQTYIKTLRSLIGSKYPLALAGFPYVDFHPGFPYSVFLGPGGAQYNAPQMYWHDIGDSVDYVYAHTYVFNRLYQRQIFPLGQVYGSPPTRQVRRFRLLARAYRAANVSWWDWQEAPPAQWHAISQPLASLRGYVTDTSLATLGPRARGDVVVWAQEHLVSAGVKLAIDGVYGAKTQKAVELFQQAHGLLADGTVGPDTWQALLRYAPVKVTWTKSGARTASVARAGAASAPVPASASLPAKRYEISRSHGRR